jgi:Mrp family chromosome partitioning ATPase
VVEVNREKPRYGKLFRVDETRGLATLATGEASVEQCIQSGPSGVSVIPAGKSDKPPLAGSDLASILRRLLKEAEDRYDVVLVDAPALLADPDTFTVCTVIPRLMLVVKARHVSFEVLQRIKKEIEQTVDNFSLVGAILNRHRRYIPGWIEEWLLK